MSALGGLRVVDLAGSVATTYAGKLFRDYGAEVINVEPPQGFPTRHLGPFVPGTGRSALHGYLNAGKLSVSDAHRDAALAGADLVLLDDPAAQPPLPDSLSTCTVSWFGRSGPWRDYRGSDAVIHALNGMMRNIGDPDGPPLIPSGYQAQIIGGVSAFIGALGHLLGQALGNMTCPFHLDTSIYEANLCFTEVGAVGAFNTGQVGARLGINRFPPTYPLGVFPCKDGWIGITVLTPSQWAAFCRILGTEQFLENPDYHSTLNRLADRHLIEPVICERLLEHSAEALFYAGQRARVPLARVPTMAELFEVDQYVARQAFAELRDGPCRYQAPVVPFRLYRTPPHHGGEVASQAEHDELVTAKPASVRATSDGVERWPLEGVRVVDLSMGWAGPLAARHLADLGADVIKVESCERFDWWRSWEATEEWIADNGAEKSVQFNLVNRNKRAITLDLEDAEGRELLLGLVADADVLIENYSAGVLPKLGLGYDVLRSVNPGLVMVSMPAFGADGPWREFRAYGSTVEHASGLPHLNGAEHHPPAMHHVAYGDAVAGLNGAAAALVALRHRRLAGEGQFVDLSQAECLFPLAAHGILTQSATGAAPARLGNDHPGAAPHGVYPCAGDDEWLLIQVFDDASWEALRELSGLPFDDLADRLARRAELDRALADWTRTQPAHALMHALQSRGITAARLQSAADLMEDAQLLARDFWQWRERAHVGRQPNPSAPYRAAQDPIQVRAPAPTLGQHNEEVLGELQGVDALRLEALRRSGVIGERPRIPGAKRNRGA